MCLNIEEDEDEERTQQLVSKIDVISRSIEKTTTTNMDRLMERMKKTQKTTDDAITSLASKHSALETHVSQHLDTLGSKLEVKKIQILFCQAHEHMMYVNALCIYIYICIYIHIHIH